MPAAVTPATVAEPRQMRISVATSQPSTSGGTGRHQLRAQLRADAGIHQHLLSARQRRRSPAG
jgi:hypothetical protein